MVVCDVVVGGGGWIRGEKAAITPPSRANHVSRAPPLNLSTSYEVVVYLYMYTTYFLFRGSFFQSGTPITSRYRSSAASLLTPW